MSQFGKVATCNLKKDIETGRSRGFGFVVYESAESIEKVCSLMHKPCVISSASCSRFHVQDS